MAKPTTLPRWARTIAGVVSAYVLDPSSTRKDEGWPPGTRPPAHVMNWWMGLVYDWITWLDSATKRTVSVVGGIDTSATWVQQDTGALKVLTTTGSTAATWKRPLEVAVGAKIKTFALRCKSGGATSYVTARLIVLNSDGTVAVQSALLTSAQDGTTNWQTITSVQDPLSGHVMATGQVAAVFIGSGGAGGGTREATSIEFDTF